VLFSDLRQVLEPDIFLVCRLAAVGTVMIDHSPGIQASQQVAHRVGVRIIIDYFVAIKTIEEKGFRRTPKKLRLINHCHNAPSRIVFGWKH